MSKAELLTTLFDEVLRHRPLEPEWDGRDIFVLSKGHSVLGYLAVLHQHGYLSTEELDTSKNLWANQDLILGFKYEVQRGLATD